MKQQRVEWLDGVRGLASFAVVFYHLLVILDIQNSSRILLDYSYYPIVNLLWNGDAAVSMFFVLSGFVLTLGIQKNHTLHLKWFLKYWIGRFCRIALPFWGVLFLSLCWVVIFYDVGDVQATNNSWFLGMWSYGAGSYDHLLQQASLIWPGIEHTLVPQGWTLTIELQISLLLPFIYFGITRWLWVTIGVTLLAGVLLHQTFAFHFLLGLLIAIYRVPITNLVDHLSLAVRWLMFACGIVLLTLVWEPENKVSEIIFWCVTGMGSAIVIVVGDRLRAVRAFFTIKPLVFLGKISYSLYLTHLFAYLVFGSLITNALPIIGVPMTLAFALVAAAIFYVVVEKTSMMLGYYLRSKL